jgi:hypothetical protein
LYPQLFIKENVSLQACNRQTHTQETTKINEEQERHRWKGAEFDHVEKKEKKNDSSKFLQAYEIKISYTLEDGHVGRNM